MNQNEVKLKPCPFCGGRAYFATWADKRVYIDVEHNDNCLNRVNGWLCSSRPIEEQIEGWNTRYESKKQKTKLWRK